MRRREPAGVPHGSAGQIRQAPFVMRLAALFEVIAIAQPEHVDRLRFVVYAESRAKG
jgi:hypothetical protein